jgi:acetyl-CoA carboxylase biotin carboxyl carrier protein
VDWELTLERARRAAEFCAASGLARFRIEEDGLEIEVRRSPRTERQQTPAGAPGTALATPAPPSSNGARPPEARPHAVVRAEIVGVVRLARPAVAEGTVVAGDRELAYVESLGIRNPIRSGAPGRVVAVHVNDGEAVEFGQPLFEIEPQ